METASNLIPPTNKNIGTAWPDDDIERLGDQIVSLTLKEANELMRYLQYFYEGYGNVRLIRSVEG